MSLDIGCKDTICALSSAQGYGAIAIVRASGPKALAIFDHSFRKARGQIKPAMAMHGEVVNALGELIDDVMGIYFVGNNSFTGEDSFEIHCHGNQLIVDQILQSLCQMGARLAEPGEFSMRSVLNGKLDLAQAESIADLIHAKSQMAQRVALSGIKGGLFKKTETVRSTIVSTLAEIEARMDFPDEELGGYDKAPISQKLAESINILDDLLRHADEALLIHSGARVVICGLPNAGKSTLLNRLCGKERAIVHEMAGTTRDVIEASLTLDSVPITLVDVAGIRALDEAHAIEQIGIEKALSELKLAHAIIWLADATIKDPFSGLIEHSLKEIDVPIIRVLNKAELVPEQKDEEILRISAKTGQGIDCLKEKLKKMFVSNSLVGEIFITRARQRDELKMALSHMKEARTGLSLGLADEVVTSELRGAGLAFDRLFGTTLSEDILDQIFSQFCIGK